MSRPPLPRLPCAAFWKPAALLLALTGGSGLLAQTNRDTTGSGAAGSGGGDRFDTPSRGDDRTLAPSLLYFPPNPPPIGRAIGPTSPPMGRGVAPAELTAFVNEIFYPALGSRLATRSLPSKLRAQLDEYRVAKVALQNEIRDELERGQTAEAGARAEALAALARRQAARIAALETAAEQLRRDLILSDHTWDSLRQWRLGDRERRGFSPFEIAQVMRSYAFFHPSPSPAQRRLLREISIELAMAGDSADTATAQQPYLFFSPEPARVLLPDDISPEVAAKVATYQTRKSALKKELYDAVHAHDGKRLAFLRPNALKTLAEQQAPALAALDTLAEEIRLSLASVTDPIAIVERSPLPPVLHHRVATLMADFSALQKDTARQADALFVRTREFPVQSSYRFDGDGLKYVIAVARNPGGPRGGRSDPPPSLETLAAIAEARASFASLAEDYGQRVATLINEKDAIRTEIARTLGKAKALAIDSALFAAMRVVTAKETAGQYRDYRIAVFQPGLSPGQRRLLFDSMLERLALPLPRGELQPVARGNSW